MIQCFSEKIKPVEFISVYLQFHWVEKPGSHIKCVLRSLRSKLERTVQTKVIALRCKDILSNSEAKRDRIGK